MIMKSYEKTIEFINRIEQHDDMITMHFREFSIILPKDEYDKMEPMFTEFYEINGGSRIKFVLKLTPIISNPSRR